MRINIFDKETSVDENIIEASEEEIRRQVEEYSKAERKAFDLALVFPDSFTGRVMREMIKIPYGETRSYGEISDSLGTAPIAVGQACGRNPVPIIVPCHRVVGKNALGGYSGGLGLKKKLLELEGADF
ncbi:MAG: methylated-DNA--[protein]-cysteine S-methyltransferase [Candidatus Nanohaloarchaea archaeon]